MNEAAGILEKVTKLKDKFEDPAYPEDKEQVGAWENSVRRALETLELKKNEGVKKIIEKANQEIKDIDFILLNDEALLPETRKPLVRIKRFYLWFLDLFGEAYNTVNEMEKILDQELK